MKCFTFTNWQTKAAYNHFRNEDRTEDLARILSSWRENLNKEWEENPETRGEFDCQSLGQALDNFIREQAPIYAEGGDLDDFYGDLLCDALDNVDWGNLAEAILLSLSERAEGFQELIPPN